ncbi:MAG: type II toxin-antitoxin system VapC family toxin [Candidatus Limnocylindrales bacterium]
MFVVDASVILAWSLEDESSSTAEAAIERLLAEGGLAPAHWPLEVANGLRSAERRGRIDEPSIRRLAAKLVGLPVDIAPVELSTALGVIESARRHDLSVYDAAYLDLANVRGLPVATVDDRLARACRAANVPLVID